MSRIALTNAMLFDGENDISHGSTVVLEDNRIIESVSGGGEQVLHDDDMTVDLSGYTVMPGMTTTHWHSTYHELSTGHPFGNQYPPAYTAILAARACETLVRVGYTGAVSAGAAHQIDSSLEDAIDNGIIVGPRIIPCSRELSTTGHSNDWTPWYWGVETLGASRICDGAEGFRLGVREEMHRGARMIKLFLTGGHGVNAPASQMEMTRDELAAAIETAHARGAMVRAHIANRDAILMAVELGIDIVDHADGMDEVAMREVVDAGVFVAPSPFLADQRWPTLPAGSPSSVSMKKSMDLAWDALMMMHEGGVKLTVGDDYGARGLPHGMQNQELACYVRNTNIPARAVLTWATRNGADLARRGDDLGTIEKGKIADLVIVKGNPLDDITIMSDDDNIQAVLKDGKVVAGALPE